LRAGCLRVGAAGLAAGFLATADLVVVEGFALACLGALLLVFVCFFFGAIVKCLLEN
jgi:hypothetical protein